MATLPRSIQQQLESADAILAKTNTPPQDQAPTSAPAPAPDAPADQPPVDATPAPTPAPAEPPAAPPTQQSVDWEHKFKTLQGLFNAEVPKLQTQVKTMSQQLKDATEALERAAKQPEQPAQQPTDTKDADAFGADLVEMVQRQVRAQFAPVATKLETQLGMLIKRLDGVEQALAGTSGTAQATAEEIFFSRLDEAIPEWEQLNVSQPFLDWLAQVDPVYGQPRHAALKSARDALDARRVIAVFKAYQDSLPKAPKVDPLAAQVTPRSSAAAPTQQAPKQKPTISEREVSAFYHDVATGKYRGNEQLMAQREAEINLALAEGRIV